MPASSPVVLSPSGHTASTAERSNPPANTDNEIDEAAVPSGGFAGEEDGPIVEPGDELGECHRSKTRCGELEGEREPVERVAKGDDEIVGE